MTYPSEEQNGKLVGARRDQQQFELDYTQSSVNVTSYFSRQKKHNTWSPEICFEFSSLSLDSSWFCLIFLSYFPYLLLWLHSHIFNSEWVRVRGFWYLNFIVGVTSGNRSIFFREIMYDCDGCSETRHSVRSYSLTLFALVSVFYFLT